MVLPGRGQTSPSSVNTVKVALYMCVQRPSSRVILYSVTMKLILTVTLPNPQMKLKLVSEHKCSLFCNFFVPCCHLYRSHPDIFSSTQKYLSVLLPLIFNTCFCWLSFSLKLSNNFSFSIFWLLPSVSSGWCESLSSQRNVALSLNRRSLKIQPCFTCTTLLWNLGRQSWSSCLILQYAKFVTPSSD